MFMHFWAENLGNEQDVTNKCCSVASFNDARRVAQKLGFPLYTVNFDIPFKKMVVDEFIAGYGAGETPNPCVNCNKYIKFDLLREKADALRADFIATGHYAKIARKPNGTLGLFRPKDKEKDQTYFLYNLNQKNLGRVLFPLADLTKPQVREIAKKAGLKVAEKPESQEICFVSEKAHNEFLKRHLKMKPGPIKLLMPLPSANPPRRSAPPLRGRGIIPLLRGVPAGRGVLTGVGSDAQILGQHQGLPLYTIGQRKGVEIGGTGPYYVASCDQITNTLYVVKDGEDKNLYKKVLTARDVSWVAGTAPKTPLAALAVIRYRHAPVAARIDKAAENRIIIRFSKSQRAVTAGQSVVIYRKNELLGGGVIISQINKIDKGEAHIEKS